MQGVRNYKRESNGYESEKNLYTGSQGPISGCCATEEGEEGEEEEEGEEKEAARA
jgi:hypothetical protein